MRAFLRRGLCGLDASLKRTYVPEWNNDHGADRIRLQQVAVNVRLMRRGEYPVSGISRNG